MPTGKRFSPHHPTCDSVKWRRQKHRKQRKKWKHHWLHNCNISRFLAPLLLLSAVFDGKHQQTTSTLGTVQLHSTSTQQCQLVSSRNHLGFCSTWRSMPAVNPFTGKRCFDLPVFLPMTAKIPEQTCLFVFY